MNKELSKLLGSTESCVECDEDTDGNCDICGLTLCDDCSDFHYDEHDQMDIADSEDP